MLKIGQYNRLKVLRKTSVGYYLGNDADEVLLPNKYVEKELNIDDKLRVFVYHDSEERPIATNIRPKLKLNEFAYLEITDTNNIGAFANIGLEKDLFIPFRNQDKKVEKGKFYTVYMLLDDKTGRLVGSTKINPFLNRQPHNLKARSEVKVLITGKNDIGYELIVNHTAKGLIYYDELFELIDIGDYFDAFVKKVRTDGKIDISMEKPAFNHKTMDKFALRLLNYIKQNNGFSPLHDKSDPELIKSTLGMSKKNFKKAVGALYKQRLVYLRSDGIEYKPIEN